MREEQLPPNYNKLDIALRSIGYSFEAAVADIIDNSIDATATNVLVRLVLNTEREEHAQKLLRRLQNYLALGFHRFLSGRPRKVSIRLDIFDEATRKR